MMDKQKIGCFIKEARKASGMTQQELAEKLYISGKAISKWETGTSIPNVDMLIPLSKILHVSVLEILLGEKLDEHTEIKKENVEELVQKAIILKKSEGGCKVKKQAYLFIIAVLFSIAEIFFLSNSAILWTDFISLWIVGVILTIYSFFFMMEELPAYYDENKVNFYNDGVFKIQLFNVSFNNRNWRKILTYLRYWSILFLVAAPLIEYFIYSFVSVFFKAIVIVSLIIASLFPLYYLAKKWE